MSGVEWVFEQGGWVSYALAMVSLLLWSAVTLRAIALWPARTLDVNPSLRGTSALAQFLREAHAFRTAPERLEQLAVRTNRQLSSMSSFIGTLVAVAPLLGLLGTVTGMVEMFGSLQGALKIQGETTVAGGISTALVTTQLGLVITAPGLIAAYWLMRQQLRREREVREVILAIRHGSA